MKIAVLGTGFVGLTAALGFADKGFAVTGYDQNEELMKELRSGTVPFFEPGLDDALARTYRKTFSLANDAHSAVEGAALVFLCVGTPCGDDGKADLSYLFAAVDSVIDALSPGCVLVIKSTVPPGTTDRAILPYLRAQGFQGSLAMNPEFLREGYSWQDFMEPDRIVCGCDEGDENARALLAKLYEPFDAPLHFVSAGTAEFVKYLSNSLLASLISYSNEMARIAETVGGVDIARAFKVLHQDKRLKNAGISSYIYPGCGYGGYCLPKDTMALAALAKSAGMTPRILESVIALNDEMPRNTARRIERLAGSTDAKIGVLGLSFKPDSGDVRDTPAAKIIASLLADGYHRIYAYDPVATETFRAAYGFDIHYPGSMEKVCNLSDTIALVTTWKEFKGVDKLYPGKKFCDCRYWLEG